MSDQPLSQLAAAAILHNELFRAYLDAGFTEEQALRLLIAIIQKPDHG